MEEIYINVEYPKPISQTPAEHQGSTSSKKMHHVGVLMGLLNVLLLIGLIVLGVRSHDLTSDFSTIHDNLTESLQASNDQLDFMTEERNVLNTNLTEMSKELNRLQVLLKEKIGCPRGWTVFTGSCYLLSTKSGSWDEGREDCRNQGADLAVIENDDEQAFLSTVNKNDAWIGLTDKETEGLWQWVDGSPLHLQYVFAFILCAENNSLFTV
nr:CD209 antigen-like protein C [Nothobranchius furzeri]